MKKFLVLAGLILSSLFVQGQTSTFSCSGTTALTTINTYCQNSSGTNLLPSGTDTHNLYIIPEGTPGTITVLIQGSVKGDFTDAVTCGTSSTTTPNLLTCSGIYARVRAKLTVFTGFTSVNLTYVGTSTVTHKGNGSGTLTSLTATLPIVATPNPITGAGDISCPTCATGGTIASTTKVVKGNGSGSAVATTIDDSGTTPTQTPQGLDTVTVGVNHEIPNAGTGGTAVNKTVCRNSSGNAITCLTTTVSGIEGVANIGAGTSGSVTTCFTTGCVVLFDNQTTIGHWAIPSTTVAGEMHDNGATAQTSAVQNFLITSTNSGAGTTAVVDILSPDVISGGSGGGGNVCTGCTRTIAHGTATLNPGAVASGACSTVVTVSATGTCANAAGGCSGIYDNIATDFQTDPTAVTGYVPGAMGTIIKFPTTDNVNFYYCNNTGSSITPTSTTFSWRVMR